MAGFDTSNTSLFALTAFRAAWEPAPKIQASHNVPCIRGYGEIIAAEYNLKIGVEKGTDWYDWLRLLRNMNKLLWLYAG